MVKTKELTEDLRTAIVNAHSDGYGYKKISGMLHVPVFTVCAIIKKFEEHGTIKNVGLRGHKKIKTPMLIRRLINDVKKIQ